MKFGITNILGIIVFIGSIGVTIFDMYLSLYPDYHFGLEAWHIFAGLILGISLIIIPEKKAIQLLTSLIQKYSKK